MLVQDIITAAREDYLDDEVEPYLWSNDTLIRHLNTIQKEFAKDTAILRDFSTESICKIPILSNKAVYPMDLRITEIHSGNLEKGYPTVDIKTLAWLEANIYRWRTATGSIVAIIPDYNLNLLRIIRYPDLTTGYWTGIFTFTGSTKTIYKSGAKFSVTLAIGDSFVISGTTYNGTTAVPKTFTILTVSSDSLTVNETIADETSSAGIMQKIVDTLWLNVTRLPLVALTLAGWETQSPEVPEQYHSPALIYGMLREAYSKQDSQTFDKEKEALYRGLFQQEKRKARAEQIWARSGIEDTMSPRLGAL